MDLLSRWAAVSGSAGPAGVARAGHDLRRQNLATARWCWPSAAARSIWNGVDIQLGFAPQLIDGQVFVHGLDLQKNFDPCCCEPPLSFDNRVIVIDPGHGGINVGTHSAVDGRLKRNSRSTGRCGLIRCWNRKAGRFFSPAPATWTVSNFDRVRFRQGASRGRVHQPAFQLVAGPRQQTGRAGNLLPDAGGHAVDASRADYADVWSQFSEQRL